MEAPGSQDGSTPLAVVNASDVPPGLQQMQLAAQNTVVTTYTAKNVEETELVVLSRGPNTTKWQCPHCKNTSSGAPERMRKHLTGQGTGAGVICTAISRSEIARIAKKFVEHDETNRGTKRPGRPRVYKPPASTTDDDQGGGASKKAKPAGDLAMLPTMHLRLPTMYLPIYLPLNSDTNEP
jgi:hypothetical protein